MTEIRARLADALRELDYEDTGGDLASRSCVSLERWADVLLSLPGIAIVEIEPIRSLADAIRDDIKAARSTDDNEHRSYLRGELQGVLQVYDILAAANKAENQ